MQQNWIEIIATAFALVLGFADVDRYARADSRKIALHEKRESPLDLEVGGELAGLAPGTTRFFPREALLKLPQVTFTVSDDANFKGSVEVTGVLLEELVRALGVAREDSLIVAVCDDQYRANYPQEYVRAHHPVLALKINGQPPEGWPKDAEGHGGVMGPYLISHAKFMPSFKILAYEDEPQIPWGVIRLEFRDEKKTFGAIAPRGPHAGDGDVRAGFRIAQQNCFRCHNQGEEGGKKSGRPWQVLATWAMSGPEHFASSVRNPQSINPKSQMAGSPQYDEATMKALIAYFRTFLGEEKQ